MAKQPKQQYLDPEMAPVSIPEIEDAIDDLNANKKKRKTLSDEAKTIADKFLTAMHKNELKTYTYKFKTYSVSPLERIKAKTTARPKKPKKAKAAK